MARNNVVNGKIVLISSTLGLIGLIGYSQYGPMKHAIRGTNDPYSLLKWLLHRHAQNAHAVRLSILWLNLQDSPSRYGPN